MTFVVKHSKPIIGCFIALYFTAYLYQSNALADVANLVSCKIAEEALTKAQSIRGLSIKKKVPCSMEEKNTVLSFLKASVDKKIAPERIKAEERIYKALGFIPENYRYVEELLKLYADQVGGYYDPDAKRYVMAAWLPASMQPTIAAHELTHALQDQHFDLKDFVDDNKYSTDELLARSALVEGDATAVMNDFQFQNMGFPEVAKLPSVDALILQTVIGGYFTQGFSSAPEGLRSLMIFPYTSGLRFVHFFLKRGGYKEIDKLFKNPPTTTTEILHPETYPMKRSSPSAETINNVLEGHSVRWKDTLGEFFISSWLTSFPKLKSVAAVAGEGLVFDTVLIRDDDVIVWLTQWRSKSDVNEFRNAAEEALGKKRRSMRELPDNSVVITFTPL